MKRVAVVALALAACTACTAVGPDYRAPDARVPERWTVASTGDASATSWWTAFGDPELERLVERALASNADLRVAVERLREARARRGAVRAALLPRVDADASWSRSRFSENGFLEGFGGGGGLPGAVLPGQEIELWQVGLDAGWELDLFGGRRRAIEAANGELEVARFELADARTSLAAETADAYVELVALRSRLVLARKSADSRRETAEVVREQAAGQIATELDVARAESERSAAVARALELEASVEAAKRRLDVLEGVTPGELDRDLDRDAELPQAPEAISAGIPSDLVRRRPDLRAAERRLAAATARVGVAEADLFPRFSLTGSFGLQSQALGDLASTDSRFFAIGPTVRWPILDRARIRANVEAADARARAAGIAYEGAVLRALGEVETALARLARDRVREEELARGRASAERAEELALELRRNGVIELLDVLDAQRTVAAARDAEVLARASVLRDAIALYRALGGGWDPRPELDAMAR